MVLCESMGWACIALAEHAYATNKKQIQYASEIFGGCALLTAGAYAANPKFGIVKTIKDAFN